MKYRTFGRTDVAVSEVGLGTWQLGGADWGAVDDDDALAILRQALDAGINLFDTADVYGGGRSETLLGRFLNQIDQPVHVATKMGRRVWAEGGWPERFSLEVARRHTQESLQRLGVESIFLQQWHCIPTEMLADGEAFDLMRTLQKEGLVQHWGVSIESLEEGLMCIEQPDCAALQVIYNIFRQKLRTELLPQAHEKGVAIIARVPLASGLLTGRFDKQTTFHDQDHRCYNREGEKFNVGETFAGVPFDTGVELAEEIREILQPGDAATMAQLALRWVLDEPAVTSVIPGASRPEQAKANAAASDLPPLSTEQHERLRDLYVSEIREAIRGKY